MRYECVWSQRPCLAVVSYTLLFLLMITTMTTADTSSSSLKQQEIAKSLTSVAGIKVGHHTLSERPTGCTVVLVEAGAVAGVDVRGSAPGTRETDLLSPVNIV